MDTNHLNQKEKDDAFIEASWLDQVERLEVLLKAGANINAIDTKFYYGRTPLINAMINHNLDCIKFLVKEGANLNLADDKGYTALIWASVEEYDVTNVEILIQAGANLEAIDKEGNTALMLAAYNGKLDIVDLLIKAKANVAYIDQFGSTALSFALQRNHIDIVFSLFSAMSLEQVHQEIIWRSASNLQTLFNIFKQVVIDHRMSLFKIFGPLFFETNQNNFFLNLPSEIMADILSKYVELKKEASWHAHHAEIEGMALCKAFNALTFTPSYSSKVEAEKHEEVQNNNTNNNHEPQQFKKRKI